MGNAALIHIALQQHVALSNLYSALMSGAYSIYVTPGCFTLNNFYRAITSSAFIYIAPRWLALNDLYSAEKCNACIVKTTNYDIGCKTT